MYMHAYHAYSSYHSRYWQTWKKKILVEEELHSLFNHLPMSQTVILFSGCYFASTGAVVNKTTCPLGSSSPNPKAGFTKQCAQDCILLPHSHDGHTAFRNIERRYVSHNLGEWGTMEEYQKKEMRVSMAEAEEIESRCWQQWRGLGLWGEPQEVWFDGVWKVSLENWARKDY